MQFSHESRFRFFRNIFGTQRFLKIQAARKDSSKLEHEASVSKISEEKLFYLNSKGIDEDSAKLMLIMGFIDEFKQELPMEYAVELNRLLSTTIGGV